MRPETLLEIARRNDYALPADTVEGLAGALRVPRLRALHRGLGADDERAADARRLPAGRGRLRGRGRLARRRLHRGHLLARRAGPPRRRLGRHLRRLLRRRRGGAGAARRRGPAHPRHRARLSARRGQPVVRYSVEHADRGVVGVGLGGLEAQYPPEPYAEVFELAKAEGLGSVPHAGEVAGPVGPRRARGAAGGSDPARLPRDRGSRARRRARASGTSCSTSRPSRTSAPARSPRSPSIRCRRLVEAGVRCSISTDDPAMFDTDLTRDYEAARSLGVDPRAALRGRSRGRALRRGDAGAAAHDLQRLRLGPNLRSRASLGTWPDPARNAERPPENARRRDARARGPLPAPSTAAVEGEMFFPQAAPPGEVDVRLPRARVRRRLRRLRRRRRRARDRRHPPGQQLVHRRPVGRRRAGQDRRRQPRRLQGAGRGVPDREQDRRRDRGGREVRQGAAEGLRVHADARGGLRGQGRQAARQRERDPGVGDREHGRQHVRPAPTSKLGRAVGTGRIDQELQTAANQKLTELYSGIQSSYARATQLYQQIVGRESEGSARPPAPRERGVPVARQPGRDQGVRACDQARSGHPGGAAGEAADPAPQGPGRRRSRPVRLPRWEGP